MFKVTISCVKLFSCIYLEHFLIFTHCVEIEIRIQLTNSMHEKNASNRMFAHRIKNGVDMLPLLIVLNMEHQMNVYR